MSFSIQEPVQKTWTLKIWWGERGPGNVETVRVQNYGRAVIKAHNALTLRGRKVDEGGSRGRVGHLRAPDRESYKERESNARRSSPPNISCRGRSKLEVNHLNCKLLQSSFYRFTTDFSWFGPVITFKYVRLTNSKIQHVYENERNQPIKPFQNDGYLALVFHVR